MSILRTFAVEAAKLLSLPAVWAGIAVTVAGTAAITVLNASQTMAAANAGEPERYGSSSVFETAYAAAPLGTVGAIVLGVLIVSSEYAPNSPDAGGGRQILTTLSAMPRRLVLVGVKALTVVLLTALAALAAAGACTALAGLILGDAASETVAPGDAAIAWLGAGLYWTLTGLLAFGITLLTRNGAVPLLVLIVNSSVVSFSLLLTNLTPLAHWLPDMAGRNLFGFVDPEFVMPGGLDAVPGAIVMAAWAMAAVIAGAIAFTRRDA